MCFIIDLPYSRDLWARKKVLRSLLARVSNSQPDVLSVINYDLDRRSFPRLRRRRGRLVSPRPTKRPDRLSRFTRPTTVPSILSRERRSPLGCRKRNVEVQARRIVTLQLQGPIISGF